MYLFEFSNRGINISKVFLVMEIKTKYNIGDKVWVMDDNQPTEITINGLSGEYKIIENVNYHITLYYSNDSWKICFYENEVFPTKEELLKSL